MKANEFEILDAYNRSEVARRYYKIVKPNKGYDKDQARKQFAQDTRIDVKILRSIFLSICKEQLNKLESGGELRNDWAEEAIEWMEKYL